jgi:peptidoglycan/LPS O-acetylase OafA/YrhL
LISAGLGGEERVAQHALIPRANVRFPHFDSLRAIAAISVVVFHAGQAAKDVSGAEGDIWWEPLIARLPVGVTIFFVISGFLLYRPFSAAFFDGRPAPKVRDYARRRVLRIVPAYWLALLLLFPFGLAWLPGGLWPDGLWIFGFMQIYSEETFTAGLGVSWSLCVEATFYVLIPIYAVVVARLLRGRERIAAARLELLALGVLAVLSVVFTTVAHASGAHALAETLPGNFSWFALGMGLAVVSASGWGVDSPAIRTIEERPWVPWLISAAVLVAAATVAGLPGIFEGFPSPHSTSDWAVEKVLHGLIALFLLLPAVFGSERGGGVRRFLASPAVLWVGLVSYGLYLWHGSVIHVYRESGGDLLVGGPALVLANLLLVALAITLVIAAASYYLVERPVMRLRNGISPGAIAQWLRTAARPPRQPAAGAAATGAVRVTTAAGGERVLRLSFGGGVAAPGQARARITELLRDELEPDRLDALRLVLTELISNSVRHGGVDDGGRIECVLHLDDERIRVEVSDTGRQGTPRLRTPDVGRGEGFGLFLINTLATGWGATHDPRLRVWVELPRGAAAYV